MTERAPAMPLEVISKLLEALNASGLPYMVVGSLSSNFYGESRSTKDADVVAPWEQLMAGPLSQLLGPEFSFDRQLGFETVTSTLKLKILHERTLFKVEIFGLSDDAHDQSRFERRKKANIAGMWTYIPTVEDVIVQKLRWYLRYKRSKDIDDVRKVARIQRARLDLLYLYQWTDQHGTTDLLNELLNPPDASSTPAQP
jgi:hypothetical protein